MKKKDERLVIFESLSYSSIPAAYWYVKKKYTVKYLFFKSKTQNVKWLKRFLMQYNIEEIKWGDFNFSQHFISHDLALDNIEQIYTKWFQQSKLIRQIISLLNTETVCLVYKKDLVERLESFYHVYICLNLIAENAKKKYYFYSFRIYSI